MLADFSQRFYHASLALRVGLRQWGRNLFFAYPAERQ